MYRTANSIACIFFIYLIWISLLFSSRIQIRHNKTVIASSMLLTRCALLGLHIGYFLIELFIENLWGIDLAFAMIYSTTNACMPASKSWRILGLPRFMRKSSNVFDRVYARQEFRSCLTWQSIKYRENGLYLLSCCVLFCYQSCYWIMFACEIFP